MAHMINPTIPGSIEDSSLTHISNIIVIVYIITSILAITNETIANANIFTLR